jgi:Kef-type K+ transport system membrane component KefB
MRDLSEIGVLLLMFVAGLETDVAEMRRVGKVAFWSAFGGVVLPLVAGAATASAFGFPLYWDGIFIGTILTATSVSISAQTLLEIGALRSREGATILGAAVIDDVMGIVLLSLIVAMAKASVSGVDVAQIATVVVRLVVFFALALAAGRGVSAVLAWARRLPVSQGSAVCRTCHRDGLCVGGGIDRRGRGDYRRLHCRSAHRADDVQAGHRWRHSSAGVLDFVPVFFISIGLQANGRVLGDRVAFTIALVAVAILAKAIGCAVSARWCGFTRQQSIRVGVGMISRGEVGLIIAGYGLGNGLIGRDVFSASVIVVLVTTMVTRPLLRLVFPPRRHVTASVEETIAHAPHISN